MLMLHSNVLIKNNKLHVKCLLFNFVSVCLSNSYTMVLFLMLFFSYFLQGNPDVLRLAFVEVLCVI